MPITCTQITSFSLSALFAPQKFNSFFFSYDITTIITKILIYKEYPFSEENIFLIKGKKNIILIKDTLFKYKAEILGFSLIEKNTEKTFHMKNTQYPNCPNVLLRLDHKSLAPTKIRHSTGSLRFAGISGFTLKGKTVHCPNLMQLIVSVEIRIGGNLNITIVQLILEVFFDIYPMSYAFDKRRSKTQILL